MTLKSVWAKTCVVLLPVVSFKTRHINLSYGMAEQKIDVIVTLGRLRHTIPCTEGMTFGSLRTEVASRAGVDRNCFRFLCKGRSVNDTDQVSSGAVRSDLRVMALMTKKYHEGSSARGTQGAAAQGSHDISSTLDELRAKSGPRVSAVKPAEARGDAINNDEPFVMVRTGRERYHVRIDLSSSVGDLKIRLGSMEGIAGDAKHMKLLFNGQQRNDNDVLTDIGVKRGSMFVLMFTAAHHDAIDAQNNLERIRQEVVDIEARTARFEQQLEKRIMDNSEFRIKFRELESNLTALSDQLQSNNSDQDSKEPVVQLLKKAEDRADVIRAKLR